MFICPHVHCRDEEQRHKETIEHALRVAERAGFTAIFDIGNLDKPVTTREQALRRIAIARAANSPVSYGVYLILTPDLEQVQRAVQAFHEIPAIVGFKLFAGHSTGHAGVPLTEQQYNIYRTLVQEGYERVVMAHCEKEDFIQKKSDGSQDWDPLNPITHAYARPPEAEVESVKDQIRLAKEAGYPGILHIAHISVPEAVEIVNAETELHVTCGVTPHHLLLDYTAMEGASGLLLKMNPPLRPPGMNRELLELLRQGKITWVETDHAPHTLEEKVCPPYASGIPNLQKYLEFIRCLKAQGFDEDQIRTLTYQNIVDTFGLQMEQRLCEPEYDLEGEYPFDPYAGLNVLD